MLQPFTYWLIRVSEILHLFWIEFVSWKQVICLILVKDFLISILLSESSMFDLWSWFVRTPNIEDSDFRFGISKNPQWPNEIYLAVMMTQLLENSQLTLMEEWRGWCATLTICAITAHPTSPFIRTAHKSQLGIF